MAYSCTHCGSCGRPVSGGVWRRTGVGLEMLLPGPKVLYGKRFSYQKWCEWLTPRDSNSHNFYCTNALLGSSGIFLPYNFLSLPLPFPVRPESLAKVGWYLEEVSPRSLYHVVKLFSVFTTNVLSGLPQAQLFLNSLRLGHLVVSPPLMPQAHKSRSSAPSRL